MSQHKPSLYEVISEPSLHTLVEQTKKYGEGGVLKGKFIRIGNLALLAPAIPLKREMSVSVGTLYHVDMIHAAFETPQRELSQKFIKERARMIEDNEATLPQAPTGLVDAGWFQYEEDPSTLSIFHKSDAFGRANDAGRQITAYLMQNTVGEDAYVTLAEHLSE